jgi:hypothetical protein
LFRALQLEPFSSNSQYAGKTLRVSKYMVIFCGFALAKRPIRQAPFDKPFDRLRRRLRTLLRMPLPSSTLKQLERNI